MITKTIKLLATALSAVFVCALIYLANSTTTEYETFEVSRPYVHPTPNGNSAKASRLERPTDGSVLIRTKTSSLFKGCEENFTRRTCSGIVLKVLAPATERRQYSFSKNYPGLPNPYTNFFYAMHKHGDKSCKNFDAEFFDDWFSQGLTTYRSTDSVILRAVPSSFDHCFKGSHTYHDTYTRVFWMQSGLKVRGDIFCRRKNDTLNPICRVEIFCEGGSWISSVSPIPSINAGKITYNLTSIFSGFGEFTSWLEKCELFDLELTPNSAATLKQLTEELSSKP